MCDGVETVTATARQRCGFGVTPLTASGIAAIGFGGQRRQMALMALGCNGVPATVHNKRQRWRLNCAAAEVHGRQHGQPVRSRRTSIPEYICVR